MSDNWYVFQGDQQKGPFSTSQLQQQIARGEISPTDLVWAQGVVAEWTPAEQIQELNIQRPPPPPPPPSAAPPPSHPASPPQPPSAPTPAKSTPGSSFCTACGASVTPSAEICVQCGTRVGSRATAGMTHSFCNACGASVTPSTEICVKCGTRVTGRATPGIAATDVSPKSRLAATLLAFFLGTIGVHRFYLGKTGTAVAMLLLSIVGYATIVFGVGFVFIAAVGIWALVDFILAVAGRMRDKEGRLIQQW